MTGADVHALNKAALAPRAAHECRLMGVAGNCLASRATKWLLADRSWLHARRGPRERRVRSRFTGLLLMSLL